MRIMNERPKTAGDHKGSVVWQQTVEKLAPCFDRSTLLTAGSALDLPLVPSSSRDQHERKIISDFVTSPFVPSKNSGQALSPVEG